MKPSWIKKSRFFSMCSYYPPDAPMPCACFLGKGPEVVDEMARLHSQGLLWACLGSGALSLHDLREEISGSRFWDPKSPPDAEFIEACRGRGIRVFGVIFVTQGYEIKVAADPVTGRARGLAAAGSREADGEADSITWGLDAFYGNRGPGLLRGPGLVRGPDHFYGKDELERLDRGGREFLENAACRDRKGRPSRCYWLSPSGKNPGYTVFFMCPNSPLWQMHLRKIIDIQVDAGVDGIQFDEPALLFETGGSRAGFCKSCRDRFRLHLVERYGPEWRDFDYGDYLEKAGAGALSELAYFRGYPLWKDWKRFLLLRVRDTFSELVAYARLRAKKKGREIAIASNFFNLLPHHLILAREADVISFEYTPGLPPDETNLVRFELARAVAGNRPVTGVPDIAFATFLKQLGKSGKDAELLKYFIAEAAAGDGDFMIPFSCLTLGGEGGYRPPTGPVAEYKGFFREHQEVLEGQEKIGDVRIALSFPSYFWSFDFLDYPGDHYRSFEALASLLSYYQWQYGITVLGDGALLVDSEDPATPGTPLFLPHVICATEEQIEKVMAFAEGGGRVVILGEFGLYDENYEKRQGRILEGLREGFNPVGAGGIFWSSTDLPRRYRSREGRAEPRDWLDRIARSLEISPLEIGKTTETTNVYLKAYRSCGDTIVHVLNRSYDSASGSFTAVDGLEVTVPWNEGNKKAETLFLTPEGLKIEGTAKPEGEALRIAIPPFPLYGLLVIV